MPSWGDSWYTLGMLWFDSFFDELVKIGKELTESSRGKIKSKNFALTGEQSSTGSEAYPIHDRTHARAALSMVSAHGTSAQKEEVFKDVARKYPTLAAHSSIPALQALTKEGAGGPKKETRTAWQVGKARSGKPTMRVETMLKKEKDGSLGGWKLAEGISLPTRVITVEGDNVRRTVKRPGDIPARGEDEMQDAKLEDRRSITTQMPTGGLVIGTQGSQSGVY